MTSEFWVIGVDGGGTKTTAVLADTSGTERARRTTGASNPNVVGIETAALHIAEAVSGCCNDAGVSPASLSAVVCGLAGGSNQKNRHGVRSHLYTRFGGHFPVTIDTDARIALEGALGGRPGFVIIAGTGSAVTVKASSGDVSLIGGWGRALGDEGSGFFIGMEAIKAFARNIDHMQEPSILPQTVTERLGWTSRESLLDAVYRENLEPSTLAPLVLDCAARQDAVALEILRRGARALADQVAVALPRVTTARVPIATCGGLIEHPTVYRDILEAELVSRDERITVQMPERPAVDGAVLMALTLARGGNSR